MKPHRRSMIIALATLALPALAVGDFVNYRYVSVAYQADFTNACIDVVVGRSYCKGEYWHSGWYDLLNASGLAPKRKGLFGLTETWP